ncbi:MAG: hypothetical protein QGH98_04800 [Nitrospinaceae bacterium]|nr:hypothetical protein [Nitrospinaceae bacterium]
MPLAGIGGTGASGRGVADPCDPANAGMTVASMNPIASKAKPISLFDFLCIILTSHSS